MIINIVGFLLVSALRQRQENGEVRTRFVANPHRKNKGIIVTESSEAMQIRAAYNVIENEAKPAI